MQTYPIDILERDYCAAAIAVFSNMTINTLANLYTIENACNIDKHAHTLVSQLNSVRGDVSYYLNSIQDIRPKSLDEADRKDITLRRIDNINKIDTNIDKGADLFQGIDFNVSLALTELSSYRFWALPSTLKEFEDGKSSDQPPAPPEPVRRKTPSELLALYERDPKKWTLQVLGDTFYPRDPSNRPATKKNWAWRELEKARKLIISR